MRFRILWRKSIWLFVIDMEDALDEGRDLE